MQHYQQNNIYQQDNKITIKDLNLYLSYPEQDITFEHFHKICIKRVKLLRDIENIEETTTDGSDTNKLIQKLIKDYGLNYEQDQQAYEEDELSHFVGRLGYCKTEQLQQWFVKQEGRLFKARLHSNIIKIDSSKILQKFGIEVLPVDKKFYEQFTNEILSGNRIDPSQQQNLNQKLYKTRFENAIELVSRLECFVYGGYAYIFSNNLQKIIVRHYKNQLLKSLKQCKQFLSQIIDNDERIGPIIHAMTEYYYGNDYNNKFVTSKKGSLNLADLEILYQRSFPPCMLNLMLHLKESHHLKHFGRLQLGLFLKGAGLSLQDSLKFWKTEFTKKIGSEQFEKNYAYNIKHNYGQIGKKCDYTPKSCLTIMKEKPGEQDHHGCPFTVFNQQHLKKLLMKMGITEAKYKSELQDILIKAKNQQAQAACRKTFLALHQDCQTENVGQHPNSYFEESMKFFSVEITTKDKDKKQQNVQMEEEPKQQEIT